MLTLILGRAGTGKTTAVLNAIKHKISSGETGQILVVPEQYSHDAERQLCDVCGDSLSLYGETLSFTGLCRRVFSETGGALAGMADAGGQMLLMHRALESVATRLKVFGQRGLKTGLIETLLDAVEEFKTLRIAPETLIRAAVKASNPLADKLSDLALIYDAYDALLNVHGGDKADRLTLLAEMIGESSVGNTGGIFFDGFNDFTAQELYVIEELLKKNAELTVCLTCDPDESYAGVQGSDDVFADKPGSFEDSEVFLLPRKTVDKLRSMAIEFGVEIRVNTPDMLMSAIDAAEASPAEATPAEATPAEAIYLDKAPELVFLEKNLFRYSEVKYPGFCNTVKVYAAPTLHSECEYAAFKVWEFVRSGFRWRDIGVMARNWDEYGRICETIFEKYDIPFFSGGRADILDKPPVAFISAALEVASSGWEYKNVFRYIKTGLTDIQTDDHAELENYVIKWNIRGSMWTRDWTLPPSGYGGGEDAAALERINSLRKRVAEPLAGLHEGIKGVSASGDKLKALLSFLEDTRFSDRLEDKADQLEKRGQSRLASEYTQLIDVINNAIEQMFGILGGTKLSASDFCKLFTLTLSKYDVGVIPVSLDRTALGGMAMSRRRDLKCLIVLGATDGNMPMLSKITGALSDSDRTELCMLGADIPAGLEDRLCRELNMLYSTLTLPSRELVVTYPTGTGERPSFIVKRIKSVFGLKELSLSEEEYKSAAQKPCFELALLTRGANKSAMAIAAREYFSETDGDAAKRLKNAGTIQNAGREALSANSAELLYGRGLALSATRIDRFYSCPYMHFLHNGLRLSPRIPAGFDAPEAGVFMHYVLEGVSRDIKAGAGFRDAGEELCRALTARYIDKYVHDALFDFEGASARFIYLFRRLETDVMRVVLDMLKEMRRSDFEPLDFELDFSELKNVAEKKTGKLSLRGVVDRVDGWERDGKLYLRVIDYKTGKKSFNLSDVLYGRNMQMLIYLFALRKYGSARYGKRIEPAGVLYVPARDFILKAPRNATEQEISELREKELRRDGLILDDPAVLKAMENSDQKKYLPIKPAKDGGYSGDSLASCDQIELLSGHVDHMLSRAVNEILDGEIGCSPFYKNSGDNACLYCEYRAVCRFDEDTGDKPRFARKLKTDEVWEALDRV